MSYGQVPGGMPNPYQSPQPGPGMTASGYESRGIPMFAKVMFIIDLVLSSLGAVGIVVSLVGMAMGIEEIGRQQGQTPLALLSIILGACILCLAVATDVWGLRGDARAVPAGIATFVIKIFGAVLGVVQAFLYPPPELQAQLQEEPELVGVVYGAAVCSVVFSLIYAIVWLLAVLQLRKWLQSRPAQQPQMPVAPGM